MNVYEDSSQYDDSKSEFLEEDDNSDSDSEQLKSNIENNHWFSIYRRRTNVIENAIKNNDIYTNNDDFIDKSLSEPLSNCCYDIKAESSKTRYKLKLIMYTIVGATGCYISYKYIPFYIHTFVIGDSTLNNEPTIQQAMKTLYHVNPCLILYDGWINQFFNTYHPDTYRLSLTTSVYLKLKGPILIMSYPYYKIPKRSLYNEKKPKLIFLKECMYDLTDCSIVLLPQNLTNKRKWNKKFPICIEIKTDSLIGIRRPSKSKRFIIDTEDKWFYKDLITISEQAENIYKKMFEDEIIEFKDYYCFKEGNFYSESNSNDTKTVFQSDFKNELKFDDSEPSWSKNQDQNINFEDENLIDSKWKTDRDKLYIFARNEPEKELWFHRFNLAAVYSSSNEILRKRKIESRFKLLQAYFVYMYNAYELSVVPLIQNEDKLLSNMSKGQGFLWLNMVLGRVCFDYLKNPKTLEILADKFQKKLNALRLPKVMEIIVIRSLCFGKGEIPTIRFASKPWMNHRGLWFELGIVYNGTFQVIVDTKIDIMKLQKKDALQIKEEDNESKNSNKSQNSVYEHFTREIIAEEQIPQESLPHQETRMEKFIKYILSSSIFELNYVKQILENVAKKEFRLVIVIKQLVGTLVVNMPPPPTDRVWISFKGCPQITFEAMPKVNDTNVPLINFLTKLLHNVLIKEFEKIIVLPNMTDFSIPMMNSEY
ncbi:uncharacterized protein LOC126900085 [Daktulosphaira vitifoliae]|uniref:uncharacterized protein LOC126900085 n=1 Tax=Daktulosphaira vitifoliae TaxID=58002 RepID=UPI0021A9AD85|nr:uncharacterized protein LOC126900085 [Daktulosphaira vitifoliae]